MNHKKIKKQINKINSFFDSITDDDEISKIEKDLLLSYVSKLYESILAQDDVEVATPKKVEVAQSTPAPVAVAVPEPKPAKVEPPAPVERKPFERAEKVEKIKAEVKATPVQETIVQEARMEETVIEPPAVVEKNKIELSEKMTSIFEKTGVTEISDRLSSLPLKDLTKAMGINERMFTIKELFGGNQDLFKTTMTHINKLGGYDEAKAYLINGVASELDWDSEANYKKADKFVKLVQRRFS